MHDALRNTFVIEVGDLLAEDEVLQQRRPARRGAQRVLVVRQRQALVGGERRMLAAAALVQLVTLAATVAGLGIGAFRLGGFRGRRAGLWLCHGLAPGWGCGRTRAWGF